VPLRERDYGYAVSDESVIGLMIQAVALTVIFARLGRDWHRHVGAIFVVAAVIYSGVGEVFVNVFSGEDPYRPLFDNSYVGTYVLLVSFAILIFAVVYCAAVGSRIKAAPRLLTTDPDALLSERFYDYRLMIIITIPLIFLTISGQGYGANGAVQGVGVGVTLGLSQQFFVIGLVLTSFGLIVRFGSGKIIVVLLGQSLLLSLVGERLVVVVGALMLLYLLSRFGIRLDRRSIVLGSVVLVLLTWGITSARAAEGRFNTTANSTRSELRLSFLENGFKNLFAESTRHDIAFTLGYRLDGNSYGAMELQALDSGAAPVGVTPLHNDVFLALPSFLDPKKDTIPLQDRIEKNYVEAHLPIPELEISSAPVTYLDILPTQLGSLVGEIGQRGMLLAAAVLGLLFALFDRWLRGGLGPARTILSLGFVYCVLDYEGSWDTWTTTLRGIIVLLIPIGALLALRSTRLPAKRPASNFSHLAIPRPPRVPSE